MSNLYHHHGDRITSFAEERCVGNDERFANNKQLNYKDSFV